MRMIANHG
ncbi:Protein of unknown function [Propionibacterium freudenreichii]|nr:Protein of unknown function [Propionibacterium freudenreichii subsp. freudenreichii]CEG86416.1 Protein of unknown function [Propionibacterium freudenreichii]CEG90368.1 Protein of unknown function [Propionibacterium freudenreichii]CEG94095.1 Protein of unknown function [Propionibacterium freudenreichii]CEG98958.1 Protein of unknown function [Propionibacterium freudenreichii]